MPPRPHGHGDDEEEEVIPPRADGPPFVDIHAKQGQGFAIDYSVVQKGLGPGRISLSDFLRDIELINRVYVPSARASLKFMKFGTGSMLAGLVVFIIMGIIGGTHEIRAVVMPISLVIFLVGIVLFCYSKWVEQGVIRSGASAVKKILDEELNLKYQDHPHRLHYTVGVHVREFKVNLGRTILERPILTMWCLRSPNAEGKMTDWELPEAIAHTTSVTIRSSHSVAHGMPSHHADKAAGKDKAAAKA